MQENGTQTSRQPLRGPISTLREASGKPQDGIHHDSGSITIQRACRRPSSPQSSSSALSTLYASFIGKRQHQRPTMRSNDSTGSSSTPRFQDRSSSVYLSRYIRIITCLRPPMLTLHDLRPARAALLPCGETFGFGLDPGPPRPLVLR